MDVSIWWFVDDIAVNCFTNNAIWSSDPIVQLKGQSDAGGGGRRLQGSREAASPYMAQQYCHHEGQVQGKQIEWVRKEHPIQ